MKELLKDYPQEKVGIFIAYLQKLETAIEKDGKKTNWWYSKIEKEGFANAFKKVASTGLYIDGDTITLNYRNTLVITYDYHAYMNKIKLVYPETLFDFGLVHDGDTFNMKKETGKVIYSHIIKDPFASSDKIIGAYGVIKNSKGEFIETINLSDIEKMKNSSKMGFIWKTWYDRMVLKSVIKRICSTHFKDIIKEIDEEDNLQNDPNMATKELTEIQKDAIKQAEMSDLSNELIERAISKIKYVTDKEITSKIIPYIVKNTTL